MWSLVCAGSALAWSATHLPVAHAQEAAEDTDAAEASADGEDTDADTDMDVEVESIDLGSEGAPATLSVVSEDPDEEALRAARRSTLREAETRSRRLKEDVFRSKATLTLLEELLIESATLGSGVKVTHINELTKGYEVASIRYYLDGRPLLEWDRTDGSELPKELELRNETVPAGDHVLQVIMKLNGRGGGVFRYVDALEFTLQSSYEFTVRTGRVSTLRVIATTRGAKGRTAYTERPRIVYQQGGDAAAAE